MARAVPIGPHNTINMRSKRYEEAKKLIDPKQSYTLEEGIELVKKTSNTKFDSTIELHIQLGIDPKKSEQQIRGTLTLPNSTGGTKKKIAAFVPDDKEKEARKAGADLVGGDDLIAKVAKSGKCDFDIAVATPEMMPKLAKVAKVLGPKGLMPNPKTETVGPDIVKIIEELKKGKMAFRNDDGGNIHIAVGKSSWENQKLSENIQSTLDKLRRVKPPGSKGTYFKRVTLSSSMGPGIQVTVEK